MSDTPINPQAKNPEWQNDRTVADALQSAADFIGSERTLDHVQHNLARDRRSVYTLEIYRDVRGNVHSRMLVTSNTLLVARSNLEWVPPTHAGARAERPTDSRD
jgi:hypothetical protein